MQKERANVDRKDQEINTDSPFFHRAAINRLKSDTFIIPLMVIRENTAEKVWAKRANRMV